MRTGKAMSTDLIPDDAIDKETLINIIKKDLKLFLTEPLQPHIMKSKAILVSKTNTKIADPEQTRMINIVPLALKIIDKLTYKAYGNQLW